eukprot:1333148-Prymnesium_polylepis.1
MKDQRQNNRPPLLAITCCFAAIGIANIASFARPSSLVLSRGGASVELHTNQLFSPRPHRVSRRRRRRTSSFCFSWLSRAMRVGSLYGFHRSVRSSLVSTATKKCVRGAEATVGVKAVGRSEIDYS